MRATRWHGRNEVPSTLRQASGCLIALFLCWPLAVFLDMFERTGSPLAVVGFVAFVGLATLYPSFARGSLRAGIACDDEGLSECYPLGLRRRLPWSAITAVEAVPTGAVLHHTGGRVLVGPPLADWASIVARARAVVDGEPVTPDDARPAVPPARVLHWLGYPPDGVCRCRTRFHRAAGVVNVAAAAALVWVGWQAGIVCALLTIGWCFVAQQAGYHLTLGRSGRERRVHTVLAMADGLEVHSAAGRRRVEWGALTGISYAGFFTIIASTSGDIWLPPFMSGTYDLLTAVRGALDARRSGLDLPRMTGEVPAAALSRAQLSVDAERGLSREE